MQVSKIISSPIKKHQHKLTNNVKSIATAAMLTLGTVALSSCTKDTVEFNQPQESVDIAQETFNKNFQEQMEMMYKANNASKIQNKNTQIVSQNSANKKDETNTLAAPLLLLVSGLVLILGANNFNSSRKS